MKLKNTGEPGMSGYTVLKVAETVFAIRCSYRPFRSWLEEKYGSYCSGDEPHLRLNLELEVRGDGKLANSLSVTGAELNPVTGEVDFSMRSGKPADFFGVMLQVCLRCAFIARRPPDLLLHSSGVVHGGQAYLFTGDSGSGKSTVCKLLSPDPSFTILHDEVNAVGRTEKGFSAWSTPLRGELGLTASRGGSLGAVFFLKQDRENFTVGLSSRKAAELLCYSLIPPLRVAGGKLSPEQGPSLEQLLALAGAVPCYELHFRKEPGFWDSVKNSVEKETSTGQMEVKNLWPITVR
ncbi:MAG: hypothetical protein A2Z29_08450 [Chloroflexi bacterium RBG_16_56_11]|nr:MAG: hypothetical protein A2Z29_08450 [Chloroflexi bacterium RBG_16_56_11]